MCLGGKKLVILTLSPRCHETFKERYQVGKVDMGLRLQREVEATNPEGIGDDSM